MYKTILAPLDGSKEVSWMLSSEVPQGGLCVDQKNRFWLFNYRNSPASKRIPYYRKDRSEKFLLFINKLPNGG